MASKGKNKDKGKGKDKDKGKTKKLSTKEYERALYDLQVQVAAIQESVVRDKLRVVIVLEGRDAAGKGGAIKRLTERVSPRVFRVVALPAPSDREKSQLYAQRYLRHLPAAGEVVIFDRSWYNRAGVERVLGFCTRKEYQEFLRQTPSFERLMVRDGIILLKYFFDVGPEQQLRRFKERITDPRKHWKLSATDLESVSKWWDYTEAYNELFAATDTAFAPWHIVPSDNKKRARLNFISHVVANIPHEPSKFVAPKIPERQKKPKNLADTPMYSKAVPQLF